MFYIALPNNVKFFTGLPLELRMAKELNKLTNCMERMRFYYSSYGSLYCRKWAAEILIKFREAGYKTEVSFCNAVQAVFPDASRFELVCFYEGGNTEMLYIEMAEVAYERLVQNNA